MKEKISKLIDVKSIVTIVLTVLFFILSVMKVIDGQSVMTIYTTVIAFYFGTQVQKKKEIEENGNQEILDARKLQKDEQ